MMISNHDRRSLAMRTETEFGAIFSVQDAQSTPRSWLERARRSPVSRSAGVALADCAGFALALAAAYAVCSAGPDRAGGLAHLPMLATAVFAGLLCFWAAAGRYAQRMTFHAEAGLLFGSSLVALAATGFLAFWTGADLPRLPLLAVWAAFPAAALAVRSAVRRQLDRAGVGRVRVLVVGPAAAVDRATDALRSERSLACDILRVVDAGMLEAFHDDRRLGRMLPHFDADELVVASDSAAWPGADVLRALARERVPFSVLSAPHGLPAIGCQRTSFHARDAVLLRYRDSMGNPAARAMKTALDLTLAGAAIVVLAPLFLLIAALIRMDGGPVFFAHRRIGAGGRTFRCLKFRSMVTDSERVLRELLATDPAAAVEWATTQKLRRDPRVTWIGALLRSTSLDELPQLINVLRLEMSLVGPRPIVASEAAKYADDIAFYHAAKPGLTGLWQVSGRSDTSYERRVELDCWYVRNWTFWHDVAIIVKTVPAVLARKGAM